MDTNHSIGPAIGEGQTATVHLWGSLQVLKLFKPGIKRAAVQAEARATSVANALNVGAPGVGETLTFGDSFGLVFERIQGVSMLQTLLSEPRAAGDMGRRLADRHALIHSRTAPPSMPPQARLQQIKVERSGLPEALRARVLKALAALPEASSLCHGDFHPANVMLQGVQDAVIDWNDASRGNPAMDVARTTVVVMGACLEDQRLRALSRQVAELHDAYLDHYFASCPERRLEYEQFLPLAAAGRLSEVSGDAKGWLRRIVDCGSDERPNP